MKKAFTLIEVLVVIAIVAILGSILLVNIKNVHVVTINGQKYQMKKVGGCEYIEMNGAWSEYQNWVHRGDCSNPIHQLIQAEQDKL